MPIIEFPNKNELILATQRVTESDGTESAVTVIGESLVPPFSAAAIGAIHQIAIGVGAGAGACQVGRLIQIARVYNNVGVAVGVGQVGYKAWNEGIQSLSVFDYLALAPVAGKALGLLNRMCFVAGTPVAVDWLNPAANGALLVDSAGSSALSAAETIAWLASSRWVWGATAMGTALFCLLPKRAEQKNSRDHETDEQFTNIWNLLYEPDAKVAFA